MWLIDSKHTDLGVKKWCFWASKEAPSVPCLPQCLETVCVFLTNLATLELQLFQFLHVCFLFWRNPSEIQNLSRCSLLCSKSYLNLAYLQMNERVLCRQGIGSTLDSFPLLFDLSRIIDSLLFAVLIHILVSSLQSYCWKFSHGKVIMWKSLLLHHSLFTLIPIS